MKPAALGLVILAMSAAAPAVAAPSCLDRQGDTVRCGTPGAMPVGWRLSPDAARARLAARDDAAPPGRLFGLAAVVGGLLTLLALLPDFQGRWDRQEDEDEQPDS